MDFYDISAAGMHLPGTLNLASKRKVWPGGASQPVPPRRRAAAPPRRGVTGPSRFAILHCAGIIQPLEFSFFFVFSDLVGTTSIGE
jgi:hypothetical protein